MAKDLPYTSRVPAPTNARTVHELGPRASSGPMLVRGAAEPCLWLNTADVRAGRLQRNNGTRPQLAHHRVLGDNGERTIDPRTRSRYRLVIDHHGFEMQQVLSCAAAHVVEVIDGKFSRDGYAQYQINKGIALGWIDVNGGCLVRQVAKGLVRTDRLLVDLKGAKMCAVDAKGMCKHTIAEREARQAKNKRRMDALELAAKSEEKKATESNAVLTAQIAELVAALAAAQLAPKKDPPK